MSSLSMRQWARAAWNTRCSELRDEEAISRASSSLPSLRAGPSRASSPAASVEDAKKKTSLSRATVTAATESASSAHIRAPPASM
ncbi:MAG: hypothetical protein BWY99_00827 [Synergistetes bacterium ADurb.BinA166]|nr:MAG: hypothetical protein BWY99_00827 [Synergistetes bacterium ADurb.BinA166]